MMTTGTPRPRAIAAKVAPDVPPGSTTSVRSRSTSPRFRIGPASVALWTTRHSKPRWVKIAERTSATSTSSSTMSMAALHGPAAAHLLPNVVEQYNRKYSDRAEYYFVTLSPSASRPTNARTVLCDQLRPSATVTYKTLPAENE